MSSPTLFNIFVDELICRLSGTKVNKVGCHIDGVYINNVSYAGDMVLLRASVCGLRRLLTFCEEYADSHGLIYNCKKV